MVADGRVPHKRTVAESYFGTEGKELDLRSRGGSPYKHAHQSKVYTEGRIPCCMPRLTARDHSARARARAGTKASWVPAGLDASCPNEG